jgi:SecD/SecF fusion protein
MKKSYLWRFTLIALVLGLTLFNILPTLFYYSKPLKTVVDANEAHAIAQSIAQRVNQMETESIEWVQTFAAHLQVETESVSLLTPRLIEVKFATRDGAKLFRSYLPRAGALIPFAPAELTLVASDEKRALIRRSVPVRLNPQEHFFYAAKGDGHQYEIAASRAARLAEILAGESENAYLLTHLKEATADELLQIAGAIYQFASDIEPTFRKRLLSAFTRGSMADPKANLQQLIASFEKLRDQLKKEKIQEGVEGKEWIDQKISLLEKGTGLLKKNLSQFSKSASPISYEAALAHFKSGKRVLPLGNRNPYFQEIHLDFSNDRIRLIPHPNLPSSAIELSKNEIAKLDELLIEQQGGYEIRLTEKPSTQSYLALRLDRIGSKTAEEAIALLKKEWHPKHIDFKKYPLVTWKEYEKLSPEKQRLCLVAFARVAGEGPEWKGDPHSVTLIARGLDKVLTKLQKLGDSPDAHTIRQDIESLVSLLKGLGFHLSSNKGDLLFEDRHSLPDLIAATREHIQPSSKGRYAVIEMADVEERILCLNRIETEIHQDLERWFEDYRTAQVSLNPQSRFEVPPPNHSLLWDNFFLSFRKYFRGDERKILRWGLDLSGGKTVQIELCDTNQTRVSSEEALTQGMNELYSRVNRMGVSDVSIRRVGDQVALDFPGAHYVSASELVKGSSMTFHVVNEQFSPQNPDLGGVVNAFLQEIWHEASASRKTDPTSLNDIARRRLSQHPLLQQAGLKIGEMGHDQANSEFSLSLSRVAQIRGNRPTDWWGQTHPLAIVFHNFAIEGSSLTNIRASYDPQKGNFLSFDVAKEKDRFQDWTSYFSQDKVAGTDLSHASSGRGWRMAVLLNDTIISAPTLNDSGLRDSAMISGSFSIREVQQLAADLKAGSLTYTPHILSEKSVSPELGASDRTRGLLATAVALMLVIGAMIIYYRFAGLVASVAVLFNLLILWAVLQNIQATLSLAGIAGIILTVGMAVDANVLVFERVREEYSLTQQIRSSLHAGYEKAFSAILDSNITTLIAGFILLSFDAGPVKGFALTLIIGIISSMFTALFMTRAYFDRWLLRSPKKILTMANWVGNRSIDFLKKAPVAFSLSLLLIGAGTVTTLLQGSTLLGMDFTGGHCLELELKPTDNGGYADRVKEALTKAGAAPQDIQTRELFPSNQVRILLSSHLAEEGGPFALRSSTESRLNWLLETLAPLGLSQDASSQAASSFSSTSGQMSDSMRQNALIGLALAFLAIFIYLAIRFEYKYAASALLCLFHDVFITLATLSLLHAIGVPIQIDLNTLAAIMTIIGYSLNDTIIIFDRIREEIRLHGTADLASLVNRSLNTTLSRTAITSGTTLLVLLALVCLGGASIFSFSLVMTLGVLFGTLSSWFIASPVMLMLHKKEQKEPNLVP